VTLETQAPLYFGAMLLGKSSVTVRRTATEAQAKMGAFSIGTRLAALRGGIANELLSALTGSEITLSVMDYNALVSADVSLFKFMDALRTDLHLTAVSYDQLLQTDLKAADGLQALAAVLAAADKTVEAQAITEIAVATGPDAKLKLGKLIDLGPYAGQDTVAAPLDVSVSAYNLANVMLQGANGSRQLELSIPDAGIPGIGEVTVWLAVGEPMTGAAWLTVGPPGQAQVRTAQSRLYIDAKILGASNPSGGLLSVRLPLLVELASAEARLSDVRCGSQPARHAMSVDVRPALGHVRIGDINTADLDNVTRTPTVKPATVVQIPAVKITASAEARLGGVGWAPVSFNGAEIENHAVKTAASRGFVGGVASSVADDIDLDANVLGLSLAPVTKALTSVVGAALKTAAPLLDPLIDSILAAAGLSLGEVDVKAAGVRCMPAVLVG